MKILKKSAIFATIGTVLLCATMSGSPAFAEPVSESYSIVGSSTLQDSVNALANGTNISGAAVRTLAGGVSIGSFDAYGASLIQSKPFGNQFARPRGTNDGAYALSRSIDGAPYARHGLITSIKGQVDVARSFTGPNPANPVGPLLYIPYARDALSYAYRFGPGVTAAPGIDSLSTADLTAIYNGSITSVGGVTVIARLPEDYYSDIRSGWVGFLGVGNSPAGVPDAAISQIRDNDMTDINPAGNTIEIVPFSVSSWITQLNGLSSQDTVTASGAALGKINGVSPLQTAGTTLVPNPVFYYNTSFGYDNYMVVEYARIEANGPSYDSGLASIINPSVSKSLTNFGTSPATAGAVKKKYGFLAPAWTATQRASLK